MTRLCSLALRNFRGFGSRAGVGFDHPVVFLGPEDCDGATGLQAIALWSLAVRAWCDRQGRTAPDRRDGGPVPVPGGRRYWRGMEVRTGRGNVPLEITVGLRHAGADERVTMRLRCYADEIVECTPNEATMARPEVIEAAARLEVLLLDPMFGIEADELIAHLPAHPRSVLLVDAPDAPREVLRERGIDVRLRAEAAKSESQLVVALPRKRPEPRREDLGPSCGRLSDYGVRHYVRARDKGYVLYLAGRRDLDLLRAFAMRLGHPAADAWDDDVNVHYVGGESTGSEPGRARRCAGRHFSALAPLVSDLKGVAILERHGEEHEDTEERGLRTTWWRRAGIDNYVVNPEALREYAAHQYRDAPLFRQFRPQTAEVLDALILKAVFDGRRQDFAAWKEMKPDAARRLWEARTRTIRLGEFAEEFFRRLAGRLCRLPLLGRRHFHELVGFIDPNAIGDEVSEKLDLLIPLFRNADGNPPRR